MAKGDKNDIIWLRLDIIFSITHVSKINFFWQRDIRRYPWRDIGRKMPNFIPCQVVENSNGSLFLCDNWLNLKEIAVILTETCQISNLRSQDVSKKILSDLVRKKFFHFQYATREM